MTVPTTAVRPLVYLLGAGGLGMSSLSFAGNRFNDLGFGAQSAGMAGADLALARDTAAININPAGLTQTAGSAFDVYLEPYYGLSGRHEDALGNDKTLETRYGWGDYRRELVSVACQGQLHQSRFALRALQRAHFTRYRLPDDQQKMVSALRVSYC